VRPPSEAKSYLSPRGKLIIWYPTPNVFSAIATGVVNLKALEQALSDVDTHVAQRPGAFEGLLDLSGVTDYLWDVRIRLFQWFTEQRMRINRLHVLATTPSIRLAAGVFKLALGEFIQVVPNHATYEKAFQSLVSVSPPRR
jgi:hypothetical protein